MLSYAVVSVICTILIVVGNDMLVKYDLPSRINESVLHINYQQWLPVCAVPLFLTAFVYWLFAKLMPAKFPLLLSGIIGGVICVIFILLTNVCSVSWDSGWYEIKNLATFFGAGFSFALLVELLD